MSYELLKAKSLLGHPMSQDDKNLLGYYEKQKGLFDGMVEAGAPTIKGTASERIAHHKDKEMQERGMAIGTSNKILKAMHDSNAINHLIMHTALQHGLDQGKALKAEDLKQTQGFLNGESRDVHHARLDGIEESAKKAKFGTLPEEFGKEVDRLREHHKAAGMSDEEMASHDWATHAIQNVIDNHKAASDPEFEKEHARGPDGSFRKMTQAEKDVVPNKDEKKD